MILINDWYIPYADDHFVVRADDFLTPAGYQSKQRDMSLENLPNKRTALDIGAHVGLWSRDLVKHFDKVIAFEPVIEHIECLKKNVPAANLEIIQTTVGEVEGTCDLSFYRENSGMTHRTDGTKYKMITIDSLNLQHVDYIKIDVEGFEHEVLLGALETLQRCRPRIVLEMKRLPHLAPGVEFRAKKYLHKVGYKEIGFFGADHIFDWPLN
jgi:FkbM family methyltransferase